MALLVGAFSFLDDLHPLSPLIRLAVQGLLAAAAVGAGLGLARLPFPGWVLDLPMWAGWVLTWLWLVWMTNLYNFMDGMDGFAGGMSVVGFGLMVVAASVAFLWYNFPPARLFMGDVGSAALGFLAAGLMLWGQRRGLFPLWLGLLVYADPPSAARRTGLAGASHALLPASGPLRMGPPQDGARRIHPDAGLCRHRPVDPRPGRRAAMGGAAGLGPDLPCPDEMGGSSQSVSG